MFTVLPVDAEETMRPRERAQDLALWQQCNPGVTTVAFPCLKNKVKNRVSLAAALHHPVLEALLWVFGRDTAI